MRRSLHEPGLTRNRRLGLLAPVGLLIALAVTLVAVSAAPAINTDPAQYSIQNDDLGVNDVPGQKDLTRQGTNNSVSGQINVLWNWDEISVSGKNSLDACTLFNSDADGNANFALCATVGNVQGSLALKATTLYTCGDARSDRCTSTAAVVANPSAATECQLEANSPTDPFTGGAGAGSDTRVFCTIVLSDVGAANAVLLNTCSYPSAEPNSDPSDCVLVPGRSNPSAVTAPKLIPQDSAVVSGLATGGTTSGSTDGKIVFSLYANADTTCTGTALFSQAISVTADGTYPTTNSGNPGATPAGYTITADGTYRWKVVYNGDSKNNPFTIACGVENVYVDVTPNPS